MSVTADLLERLQEDPWRKATPFSDDMREANDLLHYPYTREDEMRECLRQWCHKRQICTFGRAAARDRKIFFSVLTHDDLLSFTDAQLAERIAREKRLWKAQAAYSPTRPVHSFVLCVVSQRVALAAPDANLRAFSLHVAQLAGWGVENQGGRGRKNTITSEFLYLRNPRDDQYYGFQFNVDYFACAGDKQWWHDHRFPGGVAFTANSPGHMARYQEWYDGKDKPDWTLLQAMQTILHATPTNAGGPDPEGKGRATWLLPLTPDGKPVVEHLTCPLSSVPATLAGKDWTRYEGLYHTDHAVRDEFFTSRSGGTAPTHDRPYTAELSYLYNPDEDGFVEFTRGKLTDRAELSALIGTPADWEGRSAAPTPAARTDEHAAQVARKLRACEQWGSLPGLPEV